MPQPFSLITMYITVFPLISAPGAYLISRVKVRRLNELGAYFNAT